MTTNKAQNPLRKAALNGDGKSESCAPLFCRASGPAPVVGERDLALLCDLFTYGAMLPEHIHALFFAGRTRRRMNQRLQQLCSAGLVSRRPLPLGFSAALPHAAARGLPWVYGLGRDGAPLVAARLEWDLADVRRLVRLGTPTAAAHTLEIVRLRLTAEDAVRRRNDRETDGAVQMGGKVQMEFSPERLLRHAYQVRAPGGAWRDEIYKPDALLKVAFTGGPWRHFFAEVDLGHTGASEWGVKAAIALRYQKAGLFQKRYGADGFQTLVCTTGERRLARLSQLLIRKLGAENAARFGLTTFTQIASGGLLAPVWHVPGADDPLSLESWPPSAGKDREGPHPEGSAVNRGTAVNRETL